MYLAIAIISTLILLVAVIVPHDFHIETDFGSDWLSLPVLATFAATLGWVGYGTSESNIPFLITLLVSTTIGLAAAAAAAMLVKWLAKEDDSAPTLNGVVGELGKTITPIGDAKTPGQISTRVNGLPVVLTAIADRPLPTSTEVIIAELLEGGKVWVVPAQPLEVLPPEKS